MTTGYSGHPCSKEMVMNRWLPRVYPTLALCILLLVSACGGNPAGQETAAGPAKSVSSWHTPLEAAVSNAAGTGPNGAAIINSRAAISFRYVSSGDGDLKYVRATDLDGTDWGTAYTVDSNGNTGMYSSMVEVRSGFNTYPAVCYQRDGDLYYTRASNADGTSWSPLGFPKQLEAGTNSGVYSQMILTSGFGYPAIAWVNADDNSLRYVLASSTDGFSWNNVVTVVSSDVAPTGIALADVNGQPAIAFTENSTKNVKFIRATGNNGQSSSDWPGSSVTIDSGKGWDLAMVDYSGQPIVAYHGFLQGTVLPPVPDRHYIKACTASNASGSSWDTPVDIIYSDTDIFGPEVSMAVIDGVPAVAFQNLSTTELLFSIASNADGTNWWSPVVIDTNGATGYNPSLLEVNGNPTVAYNEQTNYKILFMSGTDSRGDQGTVVEVADGVHPSLAIVDGNPAIALVNSGDVEYWRSSDSGGSSWSKLQSWSNNAEDKSVCLLVVNSYPAVCYLDGTNDELWYRRGSNSTGSSAWFIGQKPDTTKADGKFTSMAIINGMPAIAYHHVTGNDVLFVQASDLNGANTWNSVYEADNGPAPGGSDDYNAEDSVGLSLVQVTSGGGTTYPAVCFSGSLSGTDYFAYSLASDSDGTGWNSASNLASGGFADGPSLAIVSGKPAVSYRLSGVKYMEASDATGTSWGSPVTLDSGGNGSTCLKATGSGLGYGPKVCYTAGSPNELRSIKRMGSPATWLNYQVVDNFGGTVGRNPDMVEGGLGHMFAYDIVDSTSTDRVRFCNSFE